ncbi:hypothetical protein RNN91_02060 [Mycoplasmopsis felis]|uniref:MGA_1079 family surface serine endopeptidase n=1 Tax=Mycoplasmopsis felis TaxID=33923 RepID=UPI002AF6A867|nr:hypothetical protein [Mycoplasmopsis felis]WQQ01713.1 hypothetical protein RRG54_03975 [Mycoplasmopsis felis]
MDKKKKRKLIIIGGVVSLVSLSTIIIGATLGLKKNYETSDEPGKTDDEKRPTDPVADNKNQEFIEKTNNLFIESYQDISAFKNKINENLKSQDTYDELTTNLYYEQLKVFLRNYTNLREELNTKQEFFVKDEVLRDSFKKFLNYQSDHKDFSFSVFGYKSYLDELNSFINRNAEIVNIKEINNKIAQIKFDAKSHEMNFLSYKKDYEDFITKFNELGLDIDYSEVVVFSNASRNFNDYLEKAIEYKNLTNQLNSIKQEYPNDITIQEEIDKYNVLIEDKSNFISDLDSLNNKIWKILDVVTKKLRSGSSDNEELNQYKTENKTFLNSLNLLTQRTKNKFIDEINASITKANIDLLKNRAVSLNSNKEEINEIIKNYQNLKTNNDPLYLNSSNKDKLEELINNNNFSAEDDELKDVENIQKNDVYLNNLVSYKNELNTEFRRLNGLVLLNEIKNNFNSLLNLRDFTNEIIQKLNNWLENQNLVNVIQEKINSLHSLQELFTIFESNKIDRNLLNSANLTQEEINQLNNLQNQTLTNINNSGQIIDFDLNNISQYKTETKQKLQNYSNKLNELKQKYNIQNVSFETLAQSKLRVELDQRLDKYDLKRYLSSLSFNKENAKLYLLEQNDSEIDYKLESVSINNENKNIVNFNYKATNKNNANETAMVRGSLNIKEVNSSIDINEKINNISITNLDELYDIDYIGLSNLKKSELNLSNLSNYIKENKTYTNEYFKYRIKNDSTSFSNQENKIQLDIEFLLNESIIKTLKINSNDVADFLPEQTLETNIKLKETFKENSDYFKAPNYFNLFAEMQNKPYTETAKEFQLFRYWFWFKKIKPFYETIKNEFNNKEFIVESATRKPDDEQGFPKLDKKYNSVQNNQLSSEEVKQILIKWFTQSDNDVLDFVVPENSTIVLKENSGSLFDVVSNELGVSAIFTFVISKNGISKEIPLKITNETYYKEVSDPVDEKYKNKIIDIFNDKSGEKLYDLINIKNSNNTHGHHSVIEKDPAAFINEFYTWPKIGKYQIFAKETISKDNLKGEAKIFFWYKDENNKEMPLTPNPSERDVNFKDRMSIVIKNWKPVQYRDIKPKNNSHFTDDDFIPIPLGQEANNLPQSDIDAINKINGRNFDYRKAQAEAGGKSVHYRVLDPKDVIEQNASLMLNYVLTLKNTVTNVDEKPNDQNGSFTNKNSNKDETPKASNSNSITLQESNIFKDSDVSNDVDTNSLYQKYFIYFYDVTSENKGEMSFKLGFINKQNTNIRYKTNHKITLINLVNDYKEKLYPEVILNKIKKSDFTIQNLNTISANQLTENNFSNYITIKSTALTYNNFNINADNIKLDEIKPHQNNKAYIKLKYVKNGATIKSNTWYLLEGFNNISNNVAELNISKTTPLTTVFEENNNVLRSRELEFYYKDALWNYDKENNRANWTLKSKYLVKTFESNNSNNRKIHLHLFGNTLVQNAKRLSRINGRGQNEGYDFTFDYDLLKTQKSISISGQTSNVYFENNGARLAPTINFNLTANLKDNNDIEFIFTITSNQYKLLVDNVQKNLLTGANFYNSPRFDEFLPEKAFLLANNGAAVHIEYKNTVEEENFQITTNKFDYNKIDYNQEGQPILFYSDPEIYNLDKYNPNQNVHYKLHDGYIQDFEFIHKTWEKNTLDIVDNSRSRTFGYSFGSATMLSKVNNDPKDGKFYIITNNHVEAGHNFDIDSITGDNIPDRENSGRYLAIAAPDYANNIDNGFSYWGGLYNVNNAKSQVIWTGLKQQNMNGDESNKFVDMTVFVIDIKPLIKQARRTGRFLQAAWLENWFKLPPLKLETNGTDHLEFFGPVRRQYAFNGFPLAKQNGYIVNRSSSNDFSVGFSRQNGYIQTFFNAGNSGTGVIGMDNQFISTINSGAPLTFLQSWAYSTNDFNYFGINWNKENPLELNNKRSLASYIMKANAKNPYLYSLPWYFKEFDE